MANIREQAISFTMGVLRRGSDWQEGQHALADSRFHSWILEEAGGDEFAVIGFVQDIIREAEGRLGDALPY